MFSTSSVARGRRLLLAPLFALLILTAAPAARTARAQEPTPAPETRPTPTPAQTPTPTPTPTPSPTPVPTPTPTPTPDDAEPIERIDTDLTSVLLSVLDKKRRFVNTLRAGDVRVVEDGVPQQIASFEQETNAPLSLVLLVDLSSSQAGVLPAERDAARSFVASVLKPRDRASLITFTGLTRLDQSLTDDRPRLEAAIDSLKPWFREDSPECAPDAPEEGKIHCYTAIWDSIAIAVREVLARTPERTRRAIILLSDGEDTKSKLRLYQAVDYAVRHNTVVYAIGIRDRRAREGEMRPDFLRQVSEGTGGRAFFPKKPADLGAAFAQIEQELRSQYLITYSPTNRARDGSFRRLRIEITDPQLKKQNLRLLYRQGYFAKQ
ncbi:MAG: VWA domain-containing protein [Acidobacteria bacterium]|nr:VWA domain-containing protein [Acidobacteriota bacterium]